MDNPNMKRNPEDHLTKTQESFLSFLAADIEHSPQNLHSISAELIDQIKTLVGDISIDINKPLPNEEQ